MDLISFVKRIGRAWPECPTQAEPGSEEKLKVLERRADRRQWLFHPHDNHWETGKLRAALQEILSLRQTRLARLS